MTDALDRFEYAAMAYGRLNKLTKDDEKTREMRKSVMAELAASRTAILSEREKSRKRVEELEAGLRWYGEIAQRAKNYEYPARKEFLHDGGDRARALLRKEGTDA